MPGHEVEVWLPEQPEFGGEQPTRVQVTDMGANTDMFHYSLCLLLSSLSNKVTGLLSDWLAFDEQRLQLEECAMFYVRRPNDVAFRITAPHHYQHTTQSWKSVCMVQNTIRKVYSTLGLRALIYIRRKHKLLCHGHC